MGGAVTPEGVMLYMFLFLVGLVFLFGPIYFLYMIVFRPKRLRLLDSYIHTGVSCNGIITRGYAESRGGRIKYHFQYAYKAPGMNSVYIKNFVNDPKGICLQHRSLIISVLPGRPESGVPQYIVSEQRMKMGRCFGVKALVSFLLTGLSVYLLFVLYSDLVIPFVLAVFWVCDDDSTRTCYRDGISFLLSTITVLSLSFVGAIWRNSLDKEIIPGVWKRLRIPRNIKRPKADYLGLNRDVPVAEVVAVLMEPEGQRIHDDDDVGNKASVDDYPLECSESVALI